MSDPRRWLDSTDATALERELLARELAATPGLDLERQVWHSLIANLPPIGGGDIGGGDLGGGAITAGAGSAISASAKLGVVAIAKSALIGALAGSVLATGVAELGDRVLPKSAKPSSEHATASALPEPPGAQTQIPPTMAAAVPHDEPAARAAVVRPGASIASPPRAAPLTSASASFELSPAGDLASRVRAERQLLESARNALQAGDPATALAWIETARKRFGAGVLAQEREVLAIEALGRAGRQAEAKSHAAAFLEMFPDSPHAAHVRRFAE